MCTYIVHLLVQCPLYWSNQFSLGDHDDEISSPVRKIRKQLKSVTDGRSFVTGYMRQYAKNYKIHGSWMSIMSDVKNSACWLWFTDLPDFGVGGSYAVPDMVSLDTC